MREFDSAALRRQFIRHSRAEYESVLLSVVEEIRALLVSTNLRFQIKHRVKDFEEYLKKLRIGLDGAPSVERIEDLMGVRIVCPFLEDLDEVEQLLASNFDLTEVDKKHQNRSFREFGYDSTHLLLALRGKEVAHPLPYVPVVCEIQLRTILQDAWAEVEHELIYKSEWPIPTFQIRRKLAALNANLSLGDIIFQELREFQRDMLRKQSKRRSLTNDSVDALSESEIHARLFEGDENRNTRGNLEKVIINALSAHAEESFQVAADLYTRALSMPGVESVRSILLNHRGMAYLSLGDVEASHAEFLAAIEADPSNFRAFYNLGSVLKSLRNSLGALEAFDACIRLNPAFVEARVKLIYLLIDLNRLDEVDAALVELKQYGADSPEISVLEEAVARRRTSPNSK